MEPSMHMKIKKYLISALLLLTCTASVFAQCTINGEEVPCDEALPTFLGIMAALGIILFICFAFWIWMLIDCLRRDFNDKVIWIVILLLTGILGAVLYYFLVKRKGTEDQKESKKAPAKATKKKR